MRRSRPHLPARRQLRVDAALHTKSTSQPRSRSSCSSALRSTTPRRPRSAPDRGARHARAALEALHRAAQPMARPVAAGRRVACRHRRRRRGGRGALRCVARAALARPQRVRRAARAESERAEASRSCSSGAVGSRRCLGSNARPALTRLSLSYSRIARLCAAADAPWPPGLRELRLAGCGDAVDDAAVARLCERCAALRDARAQRLHVARRAAAARREASPRSSSATASRSTTEALAAALEACPRLRRLDIVGCESVASLRARRHALERLTLDADPPLLALFYSAAARAERHRSS